VIQDPEAEREGWRSQSEDGSSGSEHQWPDEWHHQAYRIALVAGTRVDEQDGQH